LIIHKILIHKKRELHMANLWTCIELVSVVFYTAQRYGAWIICVTDDSLQQLPFWANGSEEWLSYLLVVKCVSSFR
jgi:hypothetical protein